VAEEAAAPEVKCRRGSQRERAKGPSANDVDVTVNRRQPACRDSVCDRAAPYPGGQQLISVHNSELEVRQPGDLGVPPAANVFERAKQAEIFWIARPNSFFVFERAIR
jgi:hypothetical protein